jgi:hypothetical protein
VYAAPRDRPNLSGLRAAEEVPLALVYEFEVGFLKDCSPSVADREVGQQAKFPGP